MLGIVVPTLDEGDRLPLLLEDLAGLRLPHRVVVADGGSTDGTPSRARGAGAVVVHAPRGRGMQMNAGAAHLDAPWLLFLHADSRLPPGSARVLEEWLASARAGAAAHFRFRLEGPGVRLRLLEIGQRLRERLTGLTYGDQGLVIDAQRFRSVGGFPPIPLFEDVAMVRRLRRAGALEALNAPLPTSPRRYRREGVVRGIARNAALVTLYLAGVSPARLAAWYRPEPSAAVPRTLVVFARAPVRGRVKTRLAAGIGSRRALEIYRELGRRVVDQVRGGPWRTVICHDPPGSTGQMTAWLGSRGVEFAPQSPGNLGERMEHAMAWALAPGGRACIIGTDAPEVDASVVEAAFRALDQADVVYGPALDGGYYLVALSSPASFLFEDIPWGTGEVLARSLERAREGGLRPHLLHPLQDIDTAADLAALGPCPPDAPAPPQTESARPGSPGRALPI